MKDFSRTYSFLSKALSPLNIPNSLPKEKESAAGKPIQDLKEKEEAAGGAEEAAEEGKEGTISAEGEATAPEGEVMGEAQSRTLKDKLVIIVPIAIVIIAVVAFFFFRRKKKTL